MAQHDQNIANGSGAVVRGDINDAFAALFSLSSGAAAPSTTVAYQWWADTANGLLKQRNAANTAWITRGDLATAFLQPADIASGGSGGLLREDGDGSSLTGINVASDYPPGFVYNAGVKLNVADSDHDIDVPVFKLRNDANDANINASLALTKQLDLPFSEGTNAGGMATGQSLPTSGFVYVFAVSKDADGSVDVISDVSSVGANVDAGWSVEKLLAKLETDASQNILGVVNHFCDKDGVSFWRYRSTDQTYTTGGSLSLAHGLPEGPSVIRMFLKNVTAGSGYSPGDQVPIGHLFTQGSGASGGASVIADNTTLNVKFGADLMQVINRSTGGNDNVVAANWRFVVEAEI